MTGSQAGLIVSTELCGRVNNGKTMLCTTQIGYINYLFGFILFLPSWEGMVGWFISSSSASQMQPDKREQKIELENLRITCLF